MCCRQFCVNAQRLQAVAESASDVGPEEVSALDTATSAAASSSAGREPHT